MWKAKIEILNSPDNFIKSPSICYIQFGKCYYMICCKQKITEDGQS